MDQLKTLLPSLRGWMQRDDNRSKKRKKQASEKRIASVSVMLMWLDISKPLGICREHYSVSILAYLYPVYKLCTNVIIMCKCVFSYILAILFMPDPQTTVEPV